MELLVMPILLLLSAGVSWLVGPEEHDDDTTTDPEPDTPQRDFLSLTDGDDQVTGDAADNLLFAGDGDDQVAGGDGDDLIFLGNGNDQNFITQDGAAQFDDGAVDGDDFVRGGAGDDLIVDFAGSNTLFGDTGRDIIDAIDQTGSAQTGDTLYGGYGSDFLAGDSGDSMFGGQGDDTFFVSLDAADPDIPVIGDYENGEKVIISVPLAFQDSALDMAVRDGGIDVTVDGNPVLRLDGVTDPDSVNLTLDASDIAPQTASPGELRIGSDGNDTMTTGGGDDAVFTGRGDDRINTGDGDDTISLRGARPFEAEGELGWGHNTVDAGAGSDRVYGGMSDDIIQGGNGNDFIDGGGGSDVIRGGSGADRIDAYDGEDGGADIIRAGVGDDFVVADYGDVVTLGDGADMLVVEAGGDAVQVTDFRPGIDKLAIDSAEGSLRLIASGRDTLVTTGGQTHAILQGVTPDQLQSGDIQRGF